MAVVLGYFTIESYFENKILNKKKAFREMPFSFKKLNEFSISD